jgi:hypothetical protein
MSHEALVITFLKPLVGVVGPRAVNVNYRHRFLAHGGHQVLTASVANLPPESAALACKARFGSFSNAGATTDMQLGRSGSRVKRRRYCIPGITRFLAPHQMPWERKGDRRGRAASDLHPGAYWLLYR